MGSYPFCPTSMWGVPLEDLWGASLGDHSIRFFRFVPLSLPLCFLGPSSNNLSVSLGPGFFRASLVIRGLGFNDSPSAFR